MLDIPLFMGSGVLGSSSRRNSPQVIVKKPKGLWYWLIVAPIKYMMIFCVWHACNMSRHFCWFHGLYPLGNHPRTPTQIT